MARNTVLFITLLILYAALKAGKSTKNEKGIDTKKDSEEKSNVSYNAYELQKYSREVDAKHYARENVEINIADQDKNAVTIKEAKKDEDVITKNGENVVAESNEKADFDEKKEDNYITEYDLGDYEEDCEGEGGEGCQGGDEEDELDWDYVTEEGIIVNAESDDEQKEVVSKEEAKKGEEENTKIGEVKVESNEVADFEKNKEEDNATEYELGDDNEYCEGGCEWEYWDYVTIKSFTKVAESDDDLIKDAATDDKNKNFINEL